MARSGVSVALHHVNSGAKAGLKYWAARYNTWLLTKLTPKGVFFSFVFIVFLFFSGLNWVEGVYPRQHRQQLCMVSIQVKAGSKWVQRA